MSWIYIEYHMTTKKYVKLPISYVMISKWFIYHLNEWYILFHRGSHSIKLDKKSKSKSWLANISLVKQNHHEHMFWFYRHSFQLNFKNI